MPIICMDSKTFLNRFIENESDKTILDASYLLASNRIRYGSRYKKQCQELFVPSDITIMKLNDENDVDPRSNSEYVMHYYKQLQSMKLLIALMIKTTLEEDLLTIILTTKLEAKTYNHLNLLRKWVRDEFDYTIEEYRNRLPLPLGSKEENDIIQLCNSIIKKEKKKKKTKLMKTTKGQREYFSSLGKKNLKKLLKKEGVYLPGMDESEMIDVAMTFLV